MIDLPVTHPSPEPPRSNAPEVEVLSPGIFNSFEQMLSVEQLNELYAMCLDDSERRIHLLQQSAADCDEGAFRRNAHAIKGTCGMVGALELASLADELERAPLPAVNDRAPYEQFLSASARLRGILIAKSIQL